MQPVNLASLLEGCQVHEHHIANFVLAYEEEFPDIEGMHFAIIGVPESRGAIDNAGCEQGPDAIRQKLYKLDAGDFDLRLADLGNLTPGASLQDTYAALGEVCRQLLEMKIIPVVLGGSHDLTYGQYLGYARNSQIINLAVIDERIDVYKRQDTIDAGSFLYRIFTETPNFLFNFSQIGYQSHFVAPEDIHTLERLYFEFYRLGVIREKIEEVEPIIRDADMVSFDISAARFADAPGYGPQTPNGFTGEEMCRIARYTGITDKVSSVGFYEMNPAFDQRGQTAHLVAQMVWYFFEGFYSRKNEYPIVNEDDFLKYSVTMESYDEPLVFWKSKKSGRWWISVPIHGNEQLEPHQLIPCSYSDYELACRDEIPERWLRAVEKLT